MAEAVLPSQAQSDGWISAMAARHRTVTHRIAAAAATAVVMTPMIGIKTVLAWVTIYVCVIALERAVVHPGKDNRAPKGLKARLFDLILFANAATFAWISYPLWQAGGIYGGICAVLYLAAGMVQSILNGTGSARITILTAMPTCTAILMAPYMLSTHGTDDNAVLALTTACIVFLGICFVAARRLYQSDRKQRLAYALAERKRAEAEDAVAARTAFLSTIAHDLRTPITAIMTGVDTLKADRRIGANEQLAMISDAGLMMNSLLNDLLDQARINAGRMELNEHPFDLRRMMAQTSRLWQNPIRAKGLKFHLDIPRDMPRAVIGDEMRLRQVLNNLLSNALKFTREGSITLRCRTWEDDAGNHALTFDVEDTGQGIADSELARLFTPFNQISSDVASLHGGSGLGLSICRDLMRLMDGRLTIRSQQDQGTILTAAVTLPPAELADVECAEPVSETVVPFIPTSFTHAVQPEPVATVAKEAAPCEAAPQEPLEVIEDEGEPVDEAPLRVLVVDDHEINRRAIQLILQPFDCDISMAGDGMTALEVASQKVFDVIFMDVRMPELDGRETTRRLRQSGGPNANTPVIAVTADNAPDDKLACTAAGMTSYLAKPLTPAALIATLQTTLEQSAKQAAA